MPDNSLAVDHLVDRLMKEQGLDPMDQAAKEKFKDETLDRINRYIISRIPEDKLVEFEELLEENNQEKISYFLEEVLGNVQGVVQDSLAY